MSNFTSFDPVNDRIARDIRNIMARTYVKYLGHDTDLVQINKLADQLLAEYPENIYADYVKERKQRYLAAKLIITDQKFTDDFFRALALWDNELFFEVHEILESLWKEARGTTKLILQAMIRAAGYYIHLGNGNLVGAKKMAARASEILIKYHEEIPPFPGLDNLLKCLDQLEPIPPKLL